MKITLTQTEYDRILSGLLSAAQHEEEIASIYVRHCYQWKTARDTATKYYQLRHKLLMADPKAPEPIRCALP